MKYKKFDIVQAISELDIYYRRIGVVMSFDKTSPFPYLVVFTYTKTRHQYGIYKESDIQRCQQTRK